MFHKSCVTNYTRISGKTFREACPMHCFRDPFVVEDSQANQDTLVEQLEANQDGVWPAPDNVLALADEVN